MKRILALLVLCSAPCLANNVQGPFNPIFVQSVQFQDGSMQNTAAVTGTVASNLAVSSGSASSSVQVTSPTANIIYDSTTFNTSAAGGNKAFVAVNFLGGGLTNTILAVNSLGVVVSTTVTGTNPNTLLSSTNTWTAGQTFISSVTLGNNLAVSNGAGASGQILQSQGAGSAPVWVSSVPAPSTLLASTNTWTGGQTFQSSATFTQTISATAIRWSDGTIQVSSPSAGGSGANTALSNLASVAVNTNLTPSGSHTTLGSDGLPWNTIYVSSSVHTTGTVLRLVNDAPALTTVDFNFASTAGDSSEVRLSGMGTNGVFFFSTFAFNKGGFGVDDNGPNGGGRLLFSPNGFMTSESFIADDDNTANDTQLSIYDVSAGAIKRISRGATDSGGTGFRVLRIAN